MASLRGVLRTLRHAPDRLLHPRRHSAATQGIRACPAPAGVLFVCYGNVCRSPYAEHRFRRALEALGRRELRIGSAGFYGPDRPSPPELCELAAARGVDLRGHRSRLVTPALLHEHGLIVAMDPGQVVRLRRLDRTGALILLLGDLDPEPIDTRAIPDPWGQSREVYSRVLDRLDRTVNALTRALGA